MLNLHDIARKLDHFVPRSLLALAGNLLRRRGDERVFSVDESGNWVNSQPQVRFVSPDLHTAHFSKVRSTVENYWFQDYRPVLGDVIIDVGAGIGEDTVIFSKVVGDSGRVHAIEAHPGTFACLKSTIELSELTNVSLHQIAINDSDGAVTISDNVEHLANSIDRAGSGHSVKALCLDSFIDECGYQQIDLLKMNIEGAESGAVLGLDRHARTIRHFAISCHDFIAHKPGGERFRTKEFVRRRLSELGFVVTDRPFAPTPWERDMLFAKRV